MCYSGKFTKAEMMRHIKGEGGLVSHLGTSSLIEVEERIDAGDSHADFVLDTMAYQIAKAIGALACSGLRRDRRRNPDGRLRSFEAPDRADKREGPLYRPGGDSPRCEGNGGPGRGHHEGARGQGELQHL